MLTHPSFAATQGEMHTHLLSVKCSNHRQHRAWLLVQEKLEAKYSSYHHAWRGAEGKRYQSSTGRLKAKNKAESDSDDDEPVGNGSGECSRWCRCMPLISFTVSETMARLENIEDVIEGDVAFVRIIFFLCFSCADGWYIQWGLDYPEEARRRMPFALQHLRRMRGIADGPQN